MIKICKYLDTIGLFKISDKIFNKFISAQYIQPTNNMNQPISDRVIPWKMVNDDFAQRDYDTYKTDQRFSPKEYLKLPGMFEPPAYPADGGTSNLSAGKTKYINYKLIEKLTGLLNFDLSGAERRQILEQIKKIKNHELSGEYLSGNPFDMQGPDEVPGPRQVIIDHSSPSMVGIDGFKWENRHFDDPSQAYKNLTPH